VALLRDCAHQKLRRAALAGLERLCLAFEQDSKSVQGPVKKILVALLRDCACPTQYAGLGDACCGFWSGSSRFLAGTAVNQYPGRSKYFKWRCFVIVPVPQSCGGLACAGAAGFWAALLRVRAGTAVNQYRAGPRQSRKISSGVASRCVCPDAEVAQNWACAAGILGCRASCLVEPQLISTGQSKIFEVRCFVCLSTQSCGGWACWTVEYGAALFRV
jgi:hypothetical protein